MFSEQEVSTSHESASTCPFCAKTGFKRLGNHLPHCHQRNGRDYSSYLSDKTLKNSQPNSCKFKFCDKCHKRFSRLDTHLRTSATCRSVASPVSLPSSLSGGNNSVPLLPTCTSNHLHAPMSPGISVQQTINDSEMKPRLQLPNSEQGWEEANTYFGQELVPQVLQAPSADTKHAVLADGVYSYFANTFGTKRMRNKNHKRQLKISNRLEKAKEMKKAARRELARAKSNSVLPVQIMSLARNFYCCIRSHNKLKKAWRRSQQAASTKSARKQCHDNFWSFSKKLFEGKSISNIEPGFSADTATTFFSTVYHTEPRDFDQPPWMPSPPKPVAGLNEEEVSLEEISLAVRRARITSSPSPFDGIPYIVFKKCPALLPALHDLFNFCWTHSKVPSAWKLASVKLISKASAEVDPTLPSNFRPIALTSCVSKLFTTILRNRWLKYMITNKYFDKTIQKAFMPTTPGCTEHHFKLATILGDARKKHKSLAVCWLDLANAFGSVHHSLISFALKHYNAPPKFSRIVSAFYTGLSAQITSSSWSTQLIPLEVGVYQGDPLSVVIFNTVINTMVDTIQTRQDLGYHFSTSQKPVNLLQYADDTCLVADSPASCQHLLQIIDKWLSWSGMKAKIPKCASLAIQASTGKKIDPKLCLHGQQIPYADQGVKFLGMRVEIPQDRVKSRTVVVAKLEHMLRKIDACPLTRKQKLLLYRAGLCPRLSWLLTIEEFPISWIEKNLNMKATSYLKKWSGLARPANTAILYLPQKMGGLNLPLLSTLHKKLQVSRQSQLLSSQDPCVRHMAEKALQNDVSLTRCKFKASKVVRNTMQADPNFTRKSLSGASKRLVCEDDQEQLFNDLMQLEKQGQMSRCTTPDGARVWGKALENVADEHLKFALNSAVDTLPHNANLCLWKKRDSDSCLLCGERQTLIHVLNTCKVARDGKRFNSRHDAILEEIVTCISTYMPSTAQLTADLNCYNFPQHIVATDLRPDIVWWDNVSKKLRVVELTICFETSFENAAERKTIKYADIIARAQESGYNATLITLEVGSRGIISIDGFTQLSKELNIPQRHLTNLLVRLSRVAIVESFKIWCKRNTEPQ